MARHVLLALPVPDSPEYGLTVSRLRTWSPGLRAEPASSWHVHLRRMGEIQSPAEILAPLRRALAKQPKLDCVVQGLGADPDVRAARQVWADVECVGVDALEARVLEAVSGIGKDPGVRDVPDHVVLAHLPKPTDVRSFLAAHEEHEFARGQLDRVTVWDAIGSGTTVTYLPLGEVTFGG